jgi:hypothetical protein
MRCSGRKLFHGIPSSSTAIMIHISHVSRVSIWVCSVKVWTNRSLSVRRSLGCISLLGHAYLTNINVYILDEAVAWRLGGLLEPLRWKNVFDSMKNHQHVPLSSISTVASFLSVLHGLINLLLLWG